MRTCFRLLCSLLAEQLLVTKRLRLVARVDELHCAAPRPQRSRVVSAGVHVVSVVGVCGRKVGKVRCAPAGARGVEDGGCAGGRDGWCGAQVPQTGVGCGRGGP
eukprot:214880-Chlamydomonas_euryale.AAC.5